MPDVNDLINSLGAGEMSTANNSFSAIMSDKLNAALDAKKVELANAMAGVETEVEVEPEAEVEIEQEVETDDEVQGISDESE